MSSKKNLNLGNSVFTRCRDIWQLCKPFDMMGGKREFCDWMFILLEVFETEHITFI